MDVFLETDRLVLRRITAADVDDLVALDADPEVMRFLSRHPTPRAEIEERYLRDRPGRWAAVERSTGDFAGWMALDRPPGDSTREMELGYRLRRTVWGRGYATEGARALVAKAFADLGAERVWAQTMAVNRGSRRVMEKAGLTYVRTFHVHFDDPLPGTEHGEVEYELLRADFSRRSTGGASPGS
ncbi:MAG: GNAT family N-acetyltransferase [Nonomuraea sp.]|nr:GNAT family N-acetyltransferase [Nonomuraea sp.]